jgi:hypothetical protein
MPSVAKAPSLIEHAVRSGEKPAIDRVALWGEANDVRGLVLAAQEITDQLRPVPGFMDGYIAMTPDQLAALNAVLSAARDKSQALAQALEW